jgi:hypothetical protein
VGKQILQIKAIDPLGLNNMTGTTVVLSAPIEMFWYDATRFSFELQWTGTPAGTFQMEGSSQYDPVTKPNATFVPFPAGTTFVNPAFTNPAGAPGSYLGSSPSTTVPRWVRLRYTNSSGTGQLSAWFYARGRS